MDGSVGMTPDPATTTVNSAALAAGSMLGLNPTTLLLATALVAIALAGVGYTLARNRSLAIQASGDEIHSTPDYYGWYAVTWMLLPALAVSVGAAVLDIVGVVGVPVVVHVAAWTALPALALWPAVRAIRADLQARRLVERVVYTVLLGAALVSIFTTIAIMLSVLFEALRFFEDVSPVEFLTGTTWAPGGAFLESVEGREGEMGTDSEFGAVPLFYGTFVITALAMLVAVPTGLLSAIYMSEYATSTVRRFAKPMLEILAGIPTVVYGFFAAITVAPLVVDAANFLDRALGLGLDASYQNALTPGVIMGVMIIPFMSSLCDDVITSVPQNIRSGSYALGATTSETVKRVVLPAALPGIVSAFLISVSRAVGETMIVVMAAGLSANITPNVFEQMTTVTVHIVANLTGDLAYDNPQTLSAFSLGLTLLVITLGLNIVSAIVIRKFRKRYEA